MPILKKILHPKRRSQSFYSEQWTEEQISEVIASKNFSNTTKEVPPPDLIDQMSQMSLIQQPGGEMHASPIPIFGYSNDLLSTTDPPLPPPSSTLPKNTVPERPRFNKQRSTPIHSSNFVLGTSREDKTLVQENLTDNEIELKANSPDVTKELDFIRQQVALFELERADWKKKFKTYQAREDQMRKQIQENQNQIHQLRQHILVEPDSDEQQHPSRHNSYQTVSTSSYTDEHYFETAEMMDDDDQAVRQMSYPDYYSAYYLQQWRNYYNGYR